MTREQIKSVQGTEDMLPGQWTYWRRLYETARRLFERYGYGEVRTPVFEDTRLFVKGTGETTDIVQKQMYSIPAGEGQGITLCPEGTPSVIRAYLEANLHKREPFQKFYYIGPMFRRERPQKGRLRQFHQLGVEAIGSASPLLDAETIMLAVDMFQEVGLKKFEVFLNSIGCAECRPRFRDEIRSLLRDRVDDLCEDCRGRLEWNVFRVLDCKNERCRDAVADFPVMTDYLCEACSGHSGQVKSALSRAGVGFREDPRLVRGLDYYTRTVYEIKHPSLGARDTICGGGRYDNLVELLGGPPMPCVGFATGAEATILAMEGELGPPADSGVRPLVYVVSFDETARPDCFGLVQALRDEGVAAEMDFEARSAKAQMRVANKRGARFCLLIGPDELKCNEVTVKDMADGRQWRVPRARAVGEIKELVAGQDSRPAR